MSLKNIVFDDDDDGDLFSEWQLGASETFVETVQGFHWNSSREPTVSFCIVYWFFPYFFPSFNFLSPLCGIQTEISYFRNASKYLNKHDFTDVQYCSINICKI